MKSLFKCWDSQTSSRDHYVERLMVYLIGGFLFIVYIDWSYWKSSPYPINTMIFYSLVFTLLFLRHSTDQQSIKDFEALFSLQLNYMPKFISASLSGASGIILTWNLFRCCSKYPLFLRTSYLVLSIFILILCYG